MKRVSIVALQMFADPDDDVNLSYYARGVMDTAITRLGDMIRFRMFQRHDDLAGVDDLVAEIALARRARLRQVAEGALCRRRFTHPRRPTQYDALGYLLSDTCVCLRPAGHDRGCVCEHAIERLVYRVDGDGREHYATRPLGRL